MSHCRLADIKPSCAVESALPETRRGISTLKTDAEMLPSDALPQAEWEALSLLADGLSLRALAGLDLAAVRLAEPWEWRAEPVALVRALRTLTWPSPALPIDVDENGMAVRRDAGDAAQRCTEPLGPSPCLACAEAASGRTPYVLGALGHARAVGALTVAVVCSAGGPVAAAADLPIEVVPGPEVLTGSTRLKAGTATKLVLNMLSTGAFVRLNKVYGNLMVDVQTTNAKLKARAVRIVAEAVACNETLAQQLLGQCDGEVKAAIVVGRKRVAPAVARTLLLTNDGSVRDALAAP
jgi:hypothetical protein